MTVTEAKQRRDAISRRLQEVIREVATNEGQVDANLNRLKETFGDEIPDDPTTIDFNKLEEDIRNFQEEVSTEITSKIEEAEGLVKELDGKLDELSGA